MRGRGLVAAAKAAGAAGAQVRFRTSNGWKFILLMCWNPFRTAADWQPEPGAWDVVASYPDIQTGMANVEKDVRNWKARIDAQYLESLE